ncbi:MAG: uroporphyrinogen decarboxylase family protein [Planctomycetota bacterium]
MQPTVDDRVECVRRAVRLERPRRMPCSDWVMLEYRPDVYHLGEGEPRPDLGEVGRTRNGKRQVTRDGGVWATDAREKYKDHNDVLNVDLDRFEVEPVAGPMLSAMARLMKERGATAYSLPLHYGTLISRATIEFGWEPFLMALALEPDRFGKILDRFGDASLAVAQGWARTDGVELIVIHDDIAATRGLLIRPEFCRQYVFPWYGRIFAAIHEAGRKVLYISDGNYRDALDDLLALKPDGLYIESSSMDPEPFMRQAGRDKLFLIKTNSQIIDVGTPEEIRAELRRLRDLHQEFPGMMIYRGGGNPSAENAKAFQCGYEEFLVYR